MNFKDIEFIPYADIRPFIRTGDSLAWSGDLRLNPLEGFGLVSKAIQIFAPGSKETRILKLNHISSPIRFNRFGCERVIQMEATAKGFIPTPVSEAIAAYHGRVYLLQLWDHLYTNEAQDDILNWLWCKAWTKYDFKSIWKQVAARVSYDTRQLFCSEGDFGSKKDGGKFYCLKDIDIAPRPCDTPLLPCYKKITRIK